MNSGSLLAGLAATALVWAHAVPGTAGDTLLLTSGRSIEVRSVVLEEGGARVVLPGGGEILLPLDAVDSVISTGKDEDSPSRRATGVGEVVPYRDTIIEACRKHGVDPVLVAALIEVESGYDPGAVSESGACGLMQILPETARDYGVDDPLDPSQNVEAGVRHLRRLLDLYHGDTALALAAYNAGEGRVAHYGGVPPFPETRDYVRRVQTLVAGWSEAESPVR